MNSTICQVELQTGSARRVLVCGGRDYRNRKLVNAVLDPLAAPGLVILQGGAAGADQLARIWAADTHAECLTFRADWEQYARAAGPIRNQQILDLGKPDLVIAFPGGRGTADMVRRAKAAGVPVQEIPA